MIPHWVGRVEEVGMEGIGMEEMGMEEIGMEVVEAYDAVIV